MSVAVRADRRFRRAHVKPARRRHRWTTRLRPWLKYGLAAVVVSYGAYSGALAAIGARVLQVDRIVVLGREHLSEGDVLALLSGLRGESLVWTDLNQWRGRVLASPWVRDVALRRRFPSTVEVTLRERRPVGIGRIGDQMYLVDERGSIIDEYGPQYAALDLPIVDGLTLTQGENGPAVDEARADLAARVIAALTAEPEIGKRLSQIDVADPHNAAIILSGDSSVIALGEDQFLTRLHTYLDLAPALRDHVREIDYVDVRFDNRVYVRPVPGSARANRGGSRGPAQQARSAPGLPKEGVR